MIVVFPDHTHYFWVRGNKNILPKERKVSDNLKCILLTELKAKSYLTKDFAGIYGTITILLVDGFTAGSRDNGAASCCCCVCICVVLGNCPVSWCVEPTTFKLYIKKRMYYKVCIKSMILILKILGQCEWP